MVLGFRQACVGPAIILVLHNFELEVPKSYQYSSLNHYENLDAFSV